MDFAQPIYVLAAWLMPTSGILQANELIISLRKKNWPQAKELHGQKILKSEKGRRVSIEIFSELGALGAVPLFVLAEKRYCTAAKVVETFLDPPYNDRVSNRFGWDIELKRDVAQMISELPDYFIHQFARAYCSANPQELQRSLKCISAGLELVGHEDLSWTIMGARPFIDKLATLEITSGAEIPGTAYRTLNMPVFVDFMCMVEVLGRLVGLGSVEMIHDEIGAFEPTYSYLLGQFKRADSKTIRLSDGKMVPYGFTALQGLEVAHSHEVPLLQAADLLATSIRSFGDTIWFGKQPSETLTELARLSLPAALIPELRFTSIMISKEFGGKLFSSVLSCNSEITSQA